MRIKITPKQLQYLTEMSVKAYHGTPHSFDKFDTSKVGSGESTQWFGWGIYLTDSEDIANWYAKSVSDSINKSIRSVSPLNYKGNIIHTEGKFYDLVLGEKTFFAKQVLYDVLRKVYGDLLKYIRGEKKWEDIPYVGNKQSIVDFIKERWESYLSNEENRISNKKPGDFMYDELHNRLNIHKKQFEKFLGGNDIDSNKAIDNIVNLNPDEVGLNDKDKLFKRSNLYSVTVHPDKTPDQYDYISWYDELTPNQKQKVINQIKTEKLKKKSFYIVKPKNEETEVQPKFFLSFSDANTYMKNWNRKNMVFGGIGIHQVDVTKGTFTIDDLNGTVKDFYTQLCGLLGSPKEASMFLLRAGIDGIKYPSNTVAGGEFRGMNYVIFDDKSINIDKRDERDI